MVRSVKEKGEREKMIQDIGNMKFHNEYKREAPDASSKVLCFRKREIFLKCHDEQIDFLSWQEVISFFPDLSDTYTYLFSIDETRYYLLPEFDTAKFEEFTWKNIEVLRVAAPKERAFAGITGFQLAGWYASRRYCPGCGVPMVQDEKERMMRCPSCGQMEYPKISPAVIVGVTDGDRLLMTKYAGRTYKQYALIAGFAEIGETIEETVQREVMEEVGVKIKNLCYYKSQPWSFSDTLLMGFFAELDGDHDIKLDERELSEAGWYTRDQIPEDDGVSLTREMMRVFKEGRIPRKNG